MSDGMVGQAARSAPQPLPPAPTPGSAKPAPDAQPVHNSSPAPAPSAAAHGQADPAVERISTDELEQMLNKVNLTFNLFEIESQVSVDQNSHELHVVVRNTRTGDVIRRIPAYEFKASFESFRSGVGVLIDRFL